MGRDFKSQHLWKPLRSPWASPGDVSPFSGSPGPRASRAPAPVHDSERPLLGLRVPSAGRTTPLTALGRGPDFLHGHGPSPHTPEAPWLTGLGKVGVGAAWDPPASPAEETLQTLRDLHLRRPRLFCPLSTTGSAQGLLSRISEKKKNAARSGWSCIHFLIEISQAPKYCFYRSVEVKYSYHSHFQKYFRPEEQRGPLPVRSHFWPRGEEPATRKE